LYVFVFAWTNPEVIVLVPASNEWKNKYEQ